MFYASGVEFAAELSDFVRHDLDRLYPELHDKIQITLVDGYNKILSTYDEEVSTNMPTFPQYACIFSYSKECPPTLIQ